MKGSQNRLQSGTNGEMVAKKEVYSFEQLDQNTESLRLQEILLFWLILEVQERGTILVKIYVSKGKG